MKVLYLHGLDYYIDDEKRKILESIYGEDNLIIPHIDYRDKAKCVDKQITKIIEDNRIDLIIGSSMGGFVGYVFGNRYNIPTKLFNPALVRQSVDIGITIEHNKDVMHTVFLGKDDDVVDGFKTMNILNEYSPKSIIIMFENVEHRFPLNIFSKLIKK